ncbi:MAG: hypothetical protein SFT92_02930 [Rickettsiales bacterium]|nr:hypothetical protein [Rickettsiales bacterium]
MSLFGSNYKAYINLAIFSCLWMTFVLLAPERHYYDFLYHYSWSSSFSAQFWSGEFYPRWLQGLYDGMGDPVFFYYPPIAYWFTALFYPLAQLDPTDFLLLNTAGLVALFLSGVSCYHWLIRHTTPKAALIGALIYIWFPSRMWFEYSFVFLYSQHLSYILLPLIMMCMEDLLAGRKGGIMRYGFFQGLLILTSVPITIIFSGLPLLYAALITPWQRYAKLVRPIVTALLIALGLSAIFWLPQQAYLPYISSTDIWKNPAYPFHYSHSFIGMNINRTDMDLTPEYVIISFFTILFIIALAGLRLRRNTSPIVKRWLGLCGVCIIMMLPISQPLWDTLPLLQTTQRPWRFFVPLCLFSASLFATSWGQQPASAAKKWEMAFHRIWTRLLPLTLVISATIFFHFHTTVQLIRPADMPYIFDTKTQLAPAFMPKTVPHEKLYDNFTTFNSQKLRRFYEAHEQVLPINCAYSDPATIKILQWDAREIKLSVPRAMQSCVIEIRQFYFPGWQAALDGELLVTEPSMARGKIRIALPERLPSDMNVITLRLQALWPEQVGAGLSLLTSLGLLLYAGIKSRGRVSKPTST